MDAGFRLARLRNAGSAQQEKRDRSWKKESGRLERGGALQRPPVRSGRPHYGTDGVPDQWEEHLIGLGARAVHLLLMTAAIRIFKSRILSMSSTVLSGVNDSW